VSKKMDKVKLPIALVVAMAAQLAAGVWWASQQAATIASLEETVSQLGSRMAIEDNVNLKRDVAGNNVEIQYVWTDVEELWEELDALTRTISGITTLQQRVALIENNLKYISRDHNSIIGPMEK
jgi:lipopolysaccharide export system protein LptA